MVRISSISTRWGCSHKDSSDGKSMVANYNVVKGIGKSKKSVVDGSLIEQTLAAPEENCSVSGIRIDLIDKVR